jgi:magnesium transporter
MALALHYSKNVLVDEAKYLDGVRVADGIGDPQKIFTWVGLIDPSAAELAVFQQRFNLSPLAVEDALSGKQRPKLDTYPEHSSLLLKTINYNTKTNRVILGDMTIMFSSNFVITVRHGDAMPLRSIRADLESHPEKLAGGVTAVLHELVDRLVDQYLGVREYLAEDVDEIEDSVFDDEVPAKATQLYFVKRELIEFRRAVWPLVQPIDRLVSGNVRDVNPASAFLFSDVRDHLLKVIEEVESMNELMNAALQANSALIQMQQNSDMRKISAYVGIGAVPTMVAGIYGMNFKYLPELEWRYGYFVVVGGLLVVCGVLFRLFHKYDWL